MQTLKNPYRYFNDMGISTSSTGALSSTETSKLASTMNQSSTHNLVSLPHELIHYILSYLSPLDLVDLSQTCHLLYTHAIDDRHWRRHVLSNVPSLTSASLSATQTWRSTYLSHNPYWFIPRGQIWFSDTPLHGKLLLARYSPSRRVIEAYTLTAERGRRRLEFWSHTPSVMMHSFNPTVRLNLDQPMLRIEAAALHSSSTADASRFRREMEMETHSAAGGVAALRNVFMLTRPTAPEGIGSGTAVWPPLTLPAEERVRNESIDGFKGTGHRPARLGEISQSTFRIRRWAEFAGHNSYGINLNLRVGEEISTFATLPRECYTPTKEKPWRGIWVGDYSGHGCEFLAILQPDEGEEFALPSQVKHMFDMRAMIRQAINHGVGDEGLEEEFLVQGEDERTSAEWLGPSVSERQRRASRASAQSALSWQRRRMSTPGTEDSDFDSASSSSPRESTADPEDSHSTNVPFDLTDGLHNMAQDEPDAKDAYSGALYAVKLTGDPNIPRGEYTFIAPDVSLNGTIRIAAESDFEGARVVRSCGHIASTGYRDDTYITSQLILASENRIAQYWESFGHISYYERVDMDALTKCE